MMSAASGTTIPREPADQLDRRAVAVWRVNNLIAGAFVIGIAAGIAIIVHFVTDDVPDWLLIGIVALVSAVTIALSWGEPELQWRRWRYEIRDDEIDLQRGWLTVTRTLVPISRVQHVDTQHGVIERRYHAATIVLHTAAGQVSIPALPEERAASIRERIAALANIHDDV